MPRTHIHPGEYLIEEYLEPLKLGANQLADALNLPRPHIGDLMHKRRGINSDTALRLGRFFGTTAQFWINLQAAYDLTTAASVTDPLRDTSQPAH